jgi:peptidyl-prolyl cis-trans isomerase B (cyclophilin B)
MKRLFLALISTLLLFAACAEAPTPDPEPSPEASLDPGNQKEDENMQNPIVTITMDDGSIIKVELYPDKAPNTVANFVTLVQAGFYDGLIFHRTGPTFMIQGGCPQGRGTGNPGYAIKGEFSANGFTQNDLRHERGVISMARGNHNNDSAGSQFFICVVDSPSLNGLYAAFGRVLEGMDTAVAIASGPNTGGQEMRALEPRTMQTVTVETFGVVYEAEKIN